MIKQEKTGEAGAEKVNVPEIKISYKNGTNQNYKIANSKDAYNVIREFFNKDTIEYNEEFLALYLNTNNKCIGWYRVSVGGLHASVVDAKVIFAVALKSAASSVILAHNHPSGNLQPSTQDRKVTETLVEGGRILGINIHDHLIVNDKAFYSFSDQGLI